MHRTQRVQTVPEPVHHLGHPSPRFEPRAHRADQSDPGRIGESTSPPSFVLDDRTPERDRAHDGSRRPCGAGALEVVEGSARVDTAAAPDVGCHVSSDTREQYPGNPATGFGRLSRLPEVDPRSGGQQARARFTFGEVPDAPPFDRLFEVEARCGTVFVRHDHHRVPGGRIGQGTWLFERPRTTYPMVGGSRRMRVCRTLLGSDSAVR